jgi:hypothetical protein
MIQLLEAMVYVSFVAMLWVQAAGVTIPSGPRVVFIILFAGCLVGEASAYAERLRRAKAEENERNARLVADLAGSDVTRAMFEGLAKTTQGGKK